MTYAYIQYIHTYIYIFSYTSFYAYRQLGLRRGCSAAFGMTVSGQESVLYVAEITDESSHAFNSGEICMYVCSATMIVFDETFLS
jgi:hypothetical protein